MVTKNKRKTIKKIITVIGRLQMNIDLFFYQQQIAIQRIENELIHHTLLNQLLSNGKAQAPRIREQTIICHLFSRKYELILIAKK